MSRNPTTHHIALPGRRTLQARVWPGDGDPVVFLHGIFASSEAWTEVCSSLDRPCIAFDLPGFGGSDLPSAPDVSAYAEDIAAGVDALGLSRFELVGHSFGGAVAARLAELLPARVTSLVLFAPAGFGRIALAEAMTIPGIRSVAEAAVWRSLARRQIALTAAAVEAARLATVALVAAGRRRATTTFTAPVTAMWGTDDRVVRPRHGRDLATAFPQADVVLVDGMGHHPLQERPDEMLQLLRTGKTPRSAKKAPPWALRRRILRPLLPVRLTPRFS